MRKIIDTDKDFTRITNLLMKEQHAKKLGPEAYLILQYIIFHREYPNYSECSASHTNIGEHLGLHRETVGKKIKLLAELGYINIREEKVGFKTRQFLTLGILPELEATEEKTPKKKRDTTKATEAKKVEKVKKVEARVAAVAADNVDPEDKLYKYYEALWTRAGENVTKYTPKQLRGSKAVKAVIEKYGEERLTKAYLLAFNLMRQEKVTGREFKLSREFIFNPEAAIKHLEEYEAQTLREEKAKAYIEQRQREDEIKQARKQEEDRVKRELRPVATGQLLAEGVLTQANLDYLEDSSVDVFARCRSDYYRKITQRVEELYASGTLSNAAD